MRLNPTPPERLCDPHGRPYFLWDVDATLEQFREQLGSPEPAVRAYMLGKLMRQARPDDVLSLVTPEVMAASWHDVERYLGKSRPFWRWLLGRWSLLPHGESA